MSKSNSLFEELIQQIPPETVRFISLREAITIKVCDLLEKKNISIRKFAEHMHEDLTTVYTWIYDIDHNLTLRSIVKMESVLSEKLIEPTI